MLYSFLNFIDSEFYVVLIQLALSIIQIISYWELFKKAGVNGWVSLIPIYSGYKIYDVVWNSKYYLLTIGLMFVNAIDIYLIKNFFATGIIMIVLTVIKVGIILLSWFIQFNFCRHLALSYGKNIGFAIGLFFLSTIFLMILAFGKSKYVGKR
ncbi:MAG: DUF5684 domain-containing protein [Ruminococcus sp.]